MRELFHTERKAQVGSSFQTHTAAPGALPGGVTSGLGGPAATVVSGAQTAALPFEERTPEQANSAAGPRPALRRPRWGPARVVCNRVYIWESCCES